MQVRALRTFNGQLGLVRTGVVITVDKRYGSHLIRNGLAAEFTSLQPQLNTALPGPERVKDEPNLGNGSSDDEADLSEEDEGSSQSRAPGLKDDSPEARPGGGRGRRSSARRQVRRSRKKT